MKTASRALIHQRRRMKKPDSSKARNIFTFTPRPTNSERIDDRPCVERVGEQLAVERRDRCAIQSP